MKTVKKVLLLFLFIGAGTLAQAQQEYPLDVNLGEVPKNSYLKDTKNELDNFVGVWTSTFEGNHITLYITKLIKKHFYISDRSYYKDVLDMRFVVKNATGGVLQDTQNMTLSANGYGYHSIYSMWVEEDGAVALFRYSGTNCGVGWGTIDFKKISSTKATWKYRPNGRIFIGNECPSSVDTEVYLPTPVSYDLVFTKTNTLSNTEGL